MDVKAVFEKGKHWIPLNVLQAISTTGGPPAMDADGKIVYHGDKGPFGWNDEAFEESLKELLG